MKRFDMDGYGGMACRTEGGGSVVIRHMALVELQDVEAMQELRYIVACQAGLVLAYDSTLPSVGKEIADTLAGKGFRITHVLGEISIGW